MSEPSTPTQGEVLAAIARERDDWETLLAEIGEARMIESGAMGDWTFKDLVAHLTGWRLRMLQRLEAAANGQPEPPAPWPASLASDDDINTWIYEQNRDRLLGEVIADSRETFARLSEAVQMLPDDALTDPGYFAWLEGEALAPVIADGRIFGHWHDEHEADIRRWLQEQTAR
ncbi:MAG: ClbS/DfsB family four-helix bundle protein [Thermomicrobiales bacterium]